ncbi:hypothetical protein JMN32_19875 [Fulvivirga sp. 29W222]|uniref:Uncharacterized protein n=1 Tax=Fulvivirga marina TaxID=2494733 RepID=A0A937KFR8_9BACT|nr:hypothetical protein [Fulvivirga marina]MBL6448580.1 hypothetical protein [Fulvivirga marina]
MTTFTTTNFDRLKELLEASPDDFIVIRKSSEGKDYKIRKSNITGSGQSASLAYDPEVTYDTPATAAVSGNPSYAEFNNKLWRSETDDNQGNQPVEGVNWTEVSANESGLIPHKPGVFKQEEVYVTGVPKAGYPKCLLRLVSATRPYETADLEAEYLAGDWEIIGFELLDEDDFVSDSATKGATQQSIKAYLLGMLGLLNNLQTTDKTNLVAAVNEVKTSVNAILTAVASNDVNYDTLQELVDFIKTIDTEGELIALIDAAVGNTTWRNPGGTLQDAYNNSLDGEIELDVLKNFKVLKSGGLVSVFELDQTEQALLLAGKSDLSSDYSLWIVDDLGNNLLKVWNDGSVEFGGSVSSFLQVQAGITSGNAGIQFPSSQPIAYRLKDDASFDYITFKTDTSGEGRAAVVIQKFVHNQGLGFRTIKAQAFSITTSSNSAQNIIGSIPVPSGNVVEVFVQQFGGRGADGNVQSGNPIKIIARNVAGTTSGANDVISVLRLGAADGGPNVNYNDTTDEIEFRFQNESTGQVYDCWVDFSYVIYPAI